MTSKKSILRLARLVMIFSITIGFFSFTGCAKKEPGVYKIGAILPLTGSAAEFGQDGKMGIDLAIEEVNTRGGVNGHKLVVTYGDSKNNPKEGVSIFNKFLATDKPPIMLCTMSSVSMTVAPLADKSKTVLFCIAAHPELTDMSPYVFRILPTTSYQAEEIALLAIDKLNIKRIAIFYINDDFGVGSKNSFEKAFSKFGGEIISIDSFEKDKIDFRSQITKLLAKNPPAIYVPGYDKALGLVVKQLREMRYKGQILAPLELSYPKVISIAQEAAEGAICADLVFDPESGDPRIKEFVQKFRSKFQKVPSLDAVLAYDEIRLVTNAAQKYGFTSEGIKKGLFEIKNFPGITGNFDILSNGDVAHPLVLKIIKNGKAVLYNP